MDHLDLIGFITTAPLSAAEWLQTSYDESQVFTGVDGESTG